MLGRFAGLGNEVGSGNWAIVRPNTAKVFLRRWGNLGAPWDRCEKGSRRRKAGDEVLAELSGNQLREKIHRAFIPQSGFQIAQPESVKDIECEAGFQKKTLDGVAIVLVDVIAVPVGNQFIEATIFDIPALVA
jgi:hypothetical protein